MKTVGFVSLGCAKNLNDAEIMMGLLAEEGYRIVDDPMKAETIVVNTCTFIESAKEESVNAILQIGTYKQEGMCKNLIVTGCLVQRYGQELQAEMPEIDGMLGTFSWNRIVEILNELENPQKDSGNLFFKDKKPLIYPNHLPRIRTGPDFAAYMKIAEGCSNGCSYCVIPSVRGSFHSRPMDSILTEARRLFIEGVKEISLIAQDTTSYGIDINSGQPLLVPLLKAIEDMEESKWLRILYCYPNRFNQELINYMKSSAKLLPYIDMPLQHIDGKILEAMNRQESEEMIRSLLTRLREDNPAIALRTTMIVGFPGETEAQFEKLCRFIEEFEFDHVGVFTYSKEENTPAARMPNQVSEEVKEERYHQLMAIQAQVSERRNRKLEGQSLEVLVEGKHETQENLWYGRSYREAPDVDGRIFIETNRELKIGEFVWVEIEQGFAYDLVGSLKS